MLKEVCEDFVFRRVFSPPHLYILLNSLLITKTYTWCPVIYREFIYRLFCIFWFNLLCLCVCIFLGPFLRQRFLFCFFWFSKTSLDVCIIGGRVPFKIFFLSFFSLTKVFHFHLPHQKKRSVLWNRECIGNTAMLL